MLMMRPPSRSRVVASRMVVNTAQVLTVIESASPVCATPPIDPAARASTYLLPVGDRTMPREAMTHMARERLRVGPIELLGGHNNYVAHPRGRPAIHDTTRRLGALPCSTPTPTTMLTTRCGLGVPADTSGVRDCRGR